MPDFNISSKYLISLKPGPFNSIKYSLLIFAGIVIGLASIKFTLFTFLIILLPIFLLLVWIKEEIGILAIVILTASIIDEEQLPVIQTGIGNFHLVDLFLLFLLSLIFIKLFFKKHNQFHTSPLDISLILFYTFAFLSTICGVAFFSVSIRNAFSELRIITYYLMFFLMTNLLHHEKQVKNLLKGLYFITFIVVSFMIFQILVGTNLRIIPARVESLSTMGQIYSSTIRVITPGNSLLFVMFIVACCSAIVQKQKNYLFSMVKILIIGIGLIIGFNRNLWIPAILVMVLFFFLASTHNKIRLFGFTAMMVMALIIITLYAHITGGRLKDYTTSAFNRLITITRGKDLVEKDTLIDRIVENRYAIEKIKNYPITGIGLGNDYRSDLDWNPKLNAYIHNGFLWILMKMGMLGFLAFMWFLIHSILRGLINWKKIVNPYFRAIYIGFTLASIGFMISALVNPVFMQWHSSPVIGLMLGGNELINRLNKPGIKTCGSF